MAISNHRLRRPGKPSVSFEWKDYKYWGQRKIFWLHVLSSGPLRIRQLGFLANRFRTPNGLLGVRPAPTDSHEPANTNAPAPASADPCPYIDTSYDRGSRSAA